MNHFIDLIPMNQYEVDLLGSIMGDGNNTWKSVVETSLALHASKFVTIGLKLRKEKGGSSIKKRCLTKMFEMEKCGRE